MKKIKVGQKVKFVYTMGILRTGIIMSVEENEVTVWCEETQNLYSLKLDQVQ